MILNTLLQSIFLVSCKCIDKGNNNIFAYTTSHLRGQTNAIFLNVSISVISQDIYQKTYRNVVFRDYIITLALHTECTRQHVFKHMWYQMYQADYC